jgi:hypothetical protein
MPEVVLISGRHFQAVVKIATICPTSELIRESRLLGAAGDRHVNTVRLRRAKWDSSDRSSADPNLEEQAR